MTSEVFVSNHDKTRQWHISISDIDFDMLGNKAIRIAMERIAERIAETYIAEHGVDVLSRISPDAVATNVMAAAAAQVNETLQKKWPDKVLTVVSPGEREVYLRGILGGMTRIR